MSREIPDKTRFFAALRPFSLVVAVATCGLGVSLALLEGSSGWALAALVVGAGVLLQAGVNLINDYSDIGRPGFSEKQRRAIRRNTRLGWLAIAMAGLVGLYLITLRGWPMAVLCAVGLLGAWGYTGAPLNYKERGLGVPVVFLMMGVLLVGGAYFAATGGYTTEVFWLSLPVSLFSSLLLLSNEIRDHEADTAAGIRTLTVRLGLEPAIRLFQTIVLLLAASTLVLGVTGRIGFEALPLLSLAVLAAPLRLLRAPPSERRRLTPLTGRGFLAFGLAFLASVWLGPQ